MKMKFSQGKSSVHIVQNISVILGAHALKYWLDFSRNEKKSVLHI